MVDTFRDTRPRSLTAWRLTNDRSNYFRQPSDVGTDFAGRDVPKMKFLFTVRFEFGGLLGELYPGSQNMAENAYACKNVTRPNINVNYVDVNSYNYRYKVATRVDYGTVTLTLYDDNKNLSHRILTAYLNAISPVARKKGGEYYTKDNIQEWASLGPLPYSEEDGLIRKMRVTQHFPSNNNDVEEEASAIHYDYINPKIQSFSLDDLDMTTSDVSHVTLTFVYDSVNIVDLSEVQFGEVGTIVPVSLDEPGA
jgi:hypothetical protein